LRSLAVVTLAAAISPAAAVQNSTNNSSDEVLLTGSLGRLVKVPANEVPSGLLPPADMGLNAQIPNPARFQGGRPDRSHGQGWSDHFG
jgi:hypothetical protein